MDAESFIQAVALALRPHGFKKAAANWRRSQPESIAVFNVQKSQWGGGVYYVNLGTYFRALGKEEKPVSYRCHVQRRLELAEPTIVVAEALQWFQQRASLQDARLLAEADSSEGMVFKELRSVAAT